MVMTMQDKVTVILNREMKLLDPEGTRYLHKSKLN